MALADLPRTLSWTPAREGWIPSALTATGADVAAAHLRLIDQRKLPQVMDYVDCFTSTQVCDAIADLTVRGAPALGVSGAYAMALWAKNEWPLLWQSRHGSGSATAGEQLAVFIVAFGARADEVAVTRPTAVNLSWGVRQMTSLVQERVAAGDELADIVDALEEAANQLADEDERRCQRIGANGAQALAEISSVLGRPLNVQTHCNAGSLATVRLGTATAAIYAAHERGIIANVWVDETRPVDQGARLTAWEMGRAGVPCTLVCDDMAGSLMAQGKVDAVIVGADRICANGDVANKIGTYQLAVLAKYHQLPFYVAAPESTFDRSLSTGAEIVIEQRDAREVRCIPSGREWLPVAPQDCAVYNPAFDVTPHDLITAIITD